MHSKTPSLSIPVKKKIKNVWTTTAEGRKGRSSCIEWTATALVQPERGIMKKSRYQENKCENSCQQNKEKSRCQQNEGESCCQKQNLNSSNCACVTI